MKLNFSSNLKFSTLLSIVSYTLTSIEKLCELFVLYKDRFSLILKFVLSRYMLVVSVVLVVLLLFDLFNFKYG